MKEHWRSGSLKNQIWPIIWESYLGCTGASSNFAIKDWDFSALNLIMFSRLSKNIAACYQEESGSSLPGSSSALDPRVWRAKNKIHTSGWFSSKHKHASKFAVLNKLDR